MTEKKVNKLLEKIWKGKYIPITKKEDALTYHLNKIDRYKKQVWKAKYQRKIFGIADGDPISLKDIINVIVKVNYLQINRTSRLWKGQE